MKIRHLHFVLEDAYGTDLFASRKIPLAVSAAKIHRLAAELKLLLHSVHEPFSGNIRTLRILKHLYDNAAGEDGNLFGISDGALQLDRQPR